MSERALFFHSRALLFCFYPAFGKGGVGWGGERNKTFSYKRMVPPTFHAFGVGGVGDEKFVLLSHGKL